MNSPNIAKTSTPDQWKSKGKKKPAAIKAAKAKTKAMIAMFKAKGWMV